MPVNKEAYGSLSHIKSFGGRILLVSFNGNPRLTVVTVYSPTEVSTNDEAEYFHNNLRSVIGSVPAHDLLFVSGDMNASLS